VEFDLTESGEPYAMSPIRIPLPARRSPGADSRRSSAPTRREARDRRARRRTRLVSLILAPVVVLGTVGLGVLGTSIAANADTFQPVVGVANVNGGQNGARDTDFILAGEDARYDVTVHNGDPVGSTGKYNLSVTALVPVGVSFEDADFLGTPTIYSDTMSLPNRTRTTPPTPAECAPMVPVGGGSTLCRPPAGFQLWVWQNVSDLPANATVTSSLVVRPNAGTFLLGTDTLEVQLTAYTSDDPTRLPTFDGSTSVSTTSGHTSQPGRAAETTPVQALRVTKTEPSPEQELPRGIHEDTTTYSILVQNSGQANTDGVTVTDLIPAGLEYLGQGGVDNTQNSNTLFDGNREYPGARSLTETLPPDALVPPHPLCVVSGEDVQTVEVGGKVFTRVIWTLGTLTPGTSQSWPSTAGVPNDCVIQYRAAVPLFENTMTWQVGTGTVSAPALQTANLNNNNGPSTRHIGPATTWTNTVDIAGTYAGGVTSPADRASSDSDTEQIDAIDLRVIKTVNPDAFQTGALALYSLALRTSEYTSARDITLTDHIANGLCPAFPEPAPGQPVAELLLDGVPASQSAWNDAVSPAPSLSCDYPADPSVGPPSLDGATVRSIDYDTAAGTFVVVFDTDAMAEQSPRDITYTVLQRPSYIPVGNHDGATSSGDTMVNTVDIEGTTDSIPALAGVVSTGPGGGSAFGTETALDDSQAAIDSRFSQLDKSVLPRGVTPAAATDADWSKHPTTRFAIGDSVWYRIRIGFAQDIETRNPMLTDFLPKGIEYVSTSYSYNLPTVGNATNVPAPVGPAAAFIPDTTVVDGVLTWELGSQTYADSTDRFIPIDSTIEFLVEGKVVGQSESPDVVDNPQNQAKYQQQNVDEEVFFLRDDASIDLELPISLTKSADRSTGLVQGDIVTYTVDVPLPQAGTNDFQIGDALPEGIHADDVVSGSEGAQLLTTDTTITPPVPVTTPVAGFTAQPIDSTTAGYPTGELRAPYDGRSLLRWDVTQSLPAASATVLQTLRLTYQVRIPDGVLTTSPAAQVEQQYRNTASIVSYDLENNGGGDTTVVPVTSDGRGEIFVGAVPAGATTVPADRTFDEAVVAIAAPRPAKELVETEIGHVGDGTTPADDANSWKTTSSSSPGQIVQGEYATFRYSVTVPQNTTVVDGVLSDDGQFRWTAPPSGSPHAYEFAGVESATWNGSTTLPVGAALDPLTGQLTLPTPFTSANAGGDVFAVTIKVWMRDRDANNPTEPDLTNGKVLTNTAGFAFRYVGTGTTVRPTATADVQYIEPSPQIVKTNDVPTAPDGTKEKVRGGESIEYTLTASNPAPRPTAFDSRVVDCVPSQLENVTFGSHTSGNTPTKSTAGPGDLDGCAPGTTKIVWGGLDLGSAPAPTRTATLTYTADVTGAPVAGAVYTNTAAITAFTLPDTVTDSGRRGVRSAETTNAVTVDSPAIVKSVDAASAPIGATRTYTLQVPLPSDVVYDDLVLTDALPAGLAFGSITSATCVDDGPAGPDCAALIPSVAVSGAVSTGQTLDWTFVTPVAQSQGDRTITIVYTATLTDAVAASPVTNSATLSWSSGGTPVSLTDDADVELLNPSLSIAKQVNTVPRDEVNPGEPFDYALTVTNTGNTPAYESVIVDTIPAGVHVIPTTISDDGVLAGVDARGGGGTITWTLSGTANAIGVSPANTKALSYRGELIDSQFLNGDDQTNEVVVQEYWSSTDKTLGREYGPSNTANATVDPVFPHVTLQKDAVGTAGFGGSPTAAYPGEPFAWTMTLVNDGVGPAQTVTATDTLPLNWTYDTDSARVKIGNGAATAIEPTLGTTPSGQVTLTWPLGEASGPGIDPLLPGTATASSSALRTVTITLTATPTDAALTDPGTTETNGTLVPHVNTLAAVVTDTSDATENAGGPTSYVTGPDPAEAYISLANLQLDKESIGGTVTGNRWSLGAGAWVPGAVVETGQYTQPQYRITVTNGGPDAAYGPFSILDTPTLPSGVTLGAFSALYYDSPSDTTPDVVTVTPPSTPGAPLVVGTSPTQGLTTGANQSRLVLTADVTVAASATGSTTNLAVVTGATQTEPTGDNEDTVTQPLSPQADLAIDKTGPATPPNAGGPLSWRLVVTNNGPSDSLSSTAQPITVTDEIPVGMTGVTLGALPAGWTANGAGPFTAGDTVTFTLGNGLRLTPAQSVQFTLDGTVVASQPAGTPIVNSATVTPRITPDPDTSNNTDQASTTPTIETTIGIAKTRVVWNGTAWVDATSLSPVPPVTPGDPVTYRVTVANTGNADAHDVTVTDEVPDYLSYTSVETVAPAAWTRTSTTGGPGADQTFALAGTLAPAASATFRVTLALDPAWNDDVVNRVLGNASNRNPSTLQPSDTDDSGSTRDANLAIVKSHSPATVVAGTSVEYTITAVNEGPSDSSGPIVITDTLPAGFSYGGGATVVVGGTPQSITPTVAGQVVTWTIGGPTSSYAPNTTFVITFDADVAPTVLAGSYVNNATVDGPDDNDPSDDSFDDPTTVTESADLSVVKTAAAGPYVAGESVIYTVTVTNAGPSVARNVSVVDTVPAGMTVTGMSGAGWTCAVPTATCTIAELPLGPSEITVEASLAANVADASSLTNTVTVTSSTPDPTTPVTDTETIVTTALADLVLQKTAVDAAGAPITTADAGTEVRYLLEVRNTGPSDAVGPLTIVDTLPAGFSFVSIADGASAWTATTDPLSPQEVTFTRTAGLAAGAEAEDLLIVVLIDPAQPVGASTNTATVESPTTDPTPVDNTGTAVVTVQQSADLSIEKVHDADAVRIGNELDFTLTVMNDGPSTATEVTVVDALPAGLEYVDADESDAAWTVTADPVAPDGTTTVTAVLTGPLVPGAMAPGLVITTLVTVAAYDEVVNTAEVTATQPDPDPSDNTSDDPVTVPPQATLVVTKEALGTLQVGSTVDYRVTLTNQGPTEDPGPITVTDTLPSGLVYRASSGTGMQCTAASGVVTCTVDGPLAVGATVQATITVGVGYAAYPEVTNGVVVTTPTEQLPGARLTATATSSVEARPLPATGGAVPGLLVAAALLLFLAGGALATYRRRREA
jgi:large repetitive protein